MDHVIIVGSNSVVKNINLGTDAKTSSTSGSITCTSPKVHELPSGVHKLMNYSLFIGDNCVFDGVDL